MTFRNRTHGLNGTVPLARRRPFWPLNCRPKGRTNAHQVVPQLQAPNHRKQVVGSRLRK
ncbi:hypothetical protein FGIG_09772 [Fasciola gigantica]|uniref:Uncharacterized protein n=1 Tax=Fasciola gigantica TaxID=46835 RepID=A0A504X0N7_FASGI|nr:hypothetical protein FGIG_09772 [Fasciola gigantica]